MQVGPRIVNDAERFPKAIQSVKECFAHSSNVGMSKLAFKAFQKNPGEFREYLDKYHMMEKAPIDLAHLPRPILAPLDKNRGGLMNMVTMSFGYAIQVSPLHTLMLYNAVANNGRMMKPYLVNSVRRDGVLVRQFEPTVIDNSIADGETVAAARECLEAVVIDGTATSVFKGMPFPVAGKTGTAHVRDGNIKYSDGIYQASFVGYFPADKPQYSCIVVIRSKPHAAIHYGGTLAGPVFREVATRLYALYVQPKVPRPFELKADSSKYFYAGAADNIRQVYSRLGWSMMDSSGAASYAALSGTGVQGMTKPVPVGKALVPDVKGMTLRDALYLLESMGAKVGVRGKGRVKQQSVAPGTELLKGTSIVLELES
jgi:cell division protein FtsI (penicillin-binding protein 3)